MEKTIITSGKTIDLAIEAALTQLGLDRDSVSVMLRCGRRLHNGFYKIVGDCRHRLLFYQNHTAIRAVFTLGEACLGAGGGYGRVDHHRMAVTAQNNVPAGNILGQKHHINGVYISVAVHVTGLDYLGGLGADAKYRSARQRKC